MGRHHRGVMPLPGAAGGEGVTLGVRARDACGRDRVCTGCGGCMRDGGAMPYGRTAGGMGLGVQCAGPHQPVPLLTSFLSSGVGVPFAAAAAAGDAGKKSEVDLLVLWFRQTLW